MKICIEHMKDKHGREPSSDVGCRMANAVLARGVIAPDYGGTCQNVVKLSPPLVITKERLHEALDILDDGFSKGEGKP
jgi:4-aminobutyrate aminotransferase-like enzyme